jgi:quercetin dioxygenase-like cupin family protein
VIEGRIGAKLGGEVVFGNPGDLIFKPRKQWHTFWNAGDEVNLLPNRLTL